MKDKKFTVLLLDEEQLDLIEILVSEEKEYMENEIKEVNVNTEIYTKILNKIAEAKKHWRKP